MTQETQDALEILKRKMQGEIKPILFTGAGFSFQAKNVYGREMPLGNTLKEWLLTELLCLDKDSDIYKDLISNSLDDIYGYAKNSNEAQAVGFLLDIFSNVKPEPHHQIVANFPWQRVYTVNIDDLFEKAFSNGTLNVINSATSIPTKYRSKLEYIKLHGCVNNKDAGFIFSKEEYQKKSPVNLIIGSQSSWRISRPKISFLSAHPAMNRISPLICSNMECRKTRGAATSISSIPSQVLFYGTR